METAVQFVTVSRAVCVSICFFVCYANKSSNASLSDSLWYRIAGSTGRAYTPGLWSETEMHNQTQTQTQECKALKMALKQSKRVQV